MSQAGHFRDYKAKHPFAIASGTDLRGAGFLVLLFALLMATSQQQVAVSWRCLSIPQLRGFDAVYPPLPSPFFAKYIFQKTYSAFCRFSQFCTRSFSIEGLS